MISLSAAIYVLQHLTQVTKGEFCLAKNKDHLIDLLNRFLVPTEESPDFEQKVHKVDKDGLEIQQPSSMIKIGFPTWQVTVTPLICTCHGLPRTSFYACPACKAPNCELSSLCRVCGILLVSASKLARTSMQHGAIFKLAPYIPIGTFLKPKRVKDSFG